MGSPTFYWYPDDTGSLTKLALASALTELHELRVPRRTSAYLGDGGAVVLTRPTATRVRIVAERKLSAADVRALRQLEDHLQRGLPVGFAREPTKAWAGFGAKTFRGFTYVSCRGNAFSKWEGSASLASGDEVTIESAPPATEIEQHLISSATTSQVNLSGETILRTMDGPILVRHRDFYPALWLPDDQLDKPIVTTERRFTYTLDVELETVPSIIAAGYDVATLPLGTTSTPATADAPTLQTMVGVGRVVRSQVQSDRAAAASALIARAMSAWKGA